MTGPYDLVLASDRAPVFTSTISRHPRTGLLKYEVAVLVGGETVVAGVPVSDALVDHLLAGRDQDGRPWVRPERTGEEMRLLAELLAGQAARGAPAPAPVQREMAVDDLRPLFDRHFGVLVVEAVGHAAQQAVGSTAAEFQEEHE